MDITVSSPRLWWRATADDLLHFVPNDPDIEDNREPRWADKYLRDWASIAQAVIAVGDQLATMQWEPFEHSLGPQFVTAKIEELPPEDAKIVQSWFTAGPTADPWEYFPDEPGITDGRHRIWNTATHALGAYLPVSANCLGCGSAEELAEWPSFVRIAREQRAQLDKVHWFDRNDPVNREYVKALTAMGSGIPVKH